MVSEVPAGPDDPVFYISSKKGNKPLTYRVFQSRLKQLIHKAGWVAAALSRRGWVGGGGGGVGGGVGGGGGGGGGGWSLAYRAKVPGELIKVEGDWASDAYLAYLSIPLEQRIQVVASHLSKVVARKGGKEVAH